eukprot:COSAG02_NODE_2843_length_7905_cov_95.905842_6_plen_687_part_01
MCAAVRAARTSCVWAHSMAARSGTGVKGTGEKASINLVRAWLRMKGYEERAPAVIRSFQTAGYQPDEWLKTLNAFSPEDLSSFLGAVSVHYTPDGRMVDTAHVGTIAQKLGDVELFASLAGSDSDEEFLKELSLELQPRRVAVGEVIIRRGDVGTEMYFLTRGEVEVLISLDGKAVATLETGASFGETALMSEERRNAYVRAGPSGVVDASVHGSEEPFVELYVLSKAGLQKTLQRYPAIEDALEEDAWQKRSQLDATTVAEVEGAGAAAAAAVPVGPMQQHAASANEQQVTLQKGPTGFGMQIDRDGRVVGYGAGGADGPAERAGVGIGSRVVAVNGYPVERKSQIIDILSNPIKCPRGVVQFMFSSESTTPTKTGPWNARADGSAGGTVAAATATADDCGELISVVFTEPGTLGLHLTRNKDTGTVDVLQINAGTQAERHTQLRAGLVLQGVGPVSVVGKSYKETLDLIKGGGRPLALSFSVGPKTSAKTGAGTLSVTFSEEGSLGLKFVNNKQTGTVDVLGVNSGTQAERHPELRPGLTLVAIGSQSTEGMEYRRVIETLKAHGRPVECHFRELVGSASADGETAVESSATDFAMNVSTDGVDETGESGKSLDNELADLLASSDDESDDAAISDVADTSLVTPVFAQAEADADAARAEHEAASAAAARAQDAVELAKKAEEIKS